MTTTAHTGHAREILGEERFLAPTVMAVLEEDPVAAKRIATTFLERMTSLKNYRTNILREGFTQEELDTVSDRLVDSFVSCGLESVRNRIDAHLAAGADHVAVNVIDDALSTERSPDQLPYAGWRKLAAILQ
jgi:probable F420-dependent oxidoreductase